ncbi:hypothetical protein [Nocardioides sp. AE5]|uniref:hypothetical protein n=1 Tax=Nocardioides sp. AE5 TaxID=2962573 RepID=UPI0028815F13|nr:hypothetical protein [Nocardioides sp. AE5]MDT0200404.1 hypothetical protein [Nocardioides sp. AE5]
MTSTERVRPVHLIRRDPTLPKSTVLGALGRTGLLVLSMGVLVLCAGASLAIGAQGLSLGTVWHEVRHDTGTIVRGLRMDSTVIAVCAGAALASVAVYVLGSGCSAVLGLLLTGAGRRCLLRRPRSQPKARNSSLRWRREPNPARRRARRSSRPTGSACRSGCCG